jgi:hypothetical protein
MQKTYWWRISLAVISLSFVGMLYIGACDHRLGRCLGGNSIPIARTAFHFFSALFIISPFLFFISDKVFLKWLRFAMIWIALSVVAIVATPDKNAFMSFDPDKETVSIWMGTLFVILSLAQFVWEWHKDKKQ